MCSVLVNSDNVLYFVLSPCTGTGKTTVLRHLVELNPNWKFLYCVYNKLVDKPFLLQYVHIIVPVFSKICGPKQIFMMTHMFTSISATTATTALIHP